MFYLLRESILPDTVESKVLVFVVRFTFMRCSPRHRSDYCESNEQFLERRLVQILTALPRVSNLCRVYSELGSKVRRLYRGERYLICGIRHLWCVE
jgi:hypothetical protein